MEKFVRYWKTKRSSILSLEIKFVLAEAAKLRNTRLGRRGNLVFARLLFPPSTRFWQMNEREEGEKKKKNTPDIRKAYFAVTLVKKEGSYKPSSRLVIAEQTESIAHNSYDVLAPRWGLSHRRRRRLPPLSRLRRPPRHSHRVRAGHAAGGAVRSNVFFYPR